MEVQFRVATQGSARRQGEHTGTGSIIPANSASAAFGWNQWRWRALSLRTPKLRKSHAERNVRKDRSRWHFKDVGFDAIALAIATASRSLRSLEWFEVVSVRGKISDNKVANYQVTLKLGLLYEPATEQSDT